MEGRYELFSGNGFCMLQRLPEHVCWHCGERATYKWWSETRDEPNKPLLRTADFYLCDHHAFQLALRMPAKLLP